MICEINASMVQVRVCCEASSETAVESCAADSCGLPLPRRGSLVNMTHQERQGDLWWSQLSDARHEVIIKVCKCYSTRIRILLHRVFQRFTRKVEFLLLGSVIRRNKDMSFCLLCIFSRCHGSRWSCPKLRDHGGHCKNCQGE